MAARTPRRTFAAPFVVTLAAIPACYHDAQPAPQPPANPPGPVVTTPPPTDPATPPPAQKPNREWRITRGKDSCLAFAAATCPPKQGDAQPTCNPPPPTKYPCPDGMTDAALIVTQLGGEGDCFILPEMPKCPPNTACNPPPPKKVQCP
jgi:hypothetical protein